MDRLFGIKKDDLSSCYLKDGIYPLLTMLTEEYPTTNKPFTVLVMDLDHFKTYNDTYGHLLGDEIIKYFSSSIRLDLSGLENYPFRFGGDEFVLVFPGRMPVEVLPIVGRMRDNIRTRQCLIRGNQIRLSFSAGVSCYPADGQKVEEILENADKALYEAKRLGRDRVVVYSLIWSKQKKKAVMVVSASVAVALLAFFLLFHGAVGDALSRASKSDVLATVRSGLGNALTDARDRVAGLVRMIQSPAVNVNPIQKEPAFLKESKAPAPAAAPVAEKAPEPTPQISTVYLKSGGSIRGVIVQETDDAIKVKLMVKKGEGSMTIKQSNVERVVHGGE